VSFFYTFSTQTQVTINLAFSPTVWVLLEQGIARDKAVMLVRMAIVMALCRSIAGAIDEEVFQ
jgi:hypothetical protein